MTVRTVPLHKQHHLPLRQIHLTTVTEAVPDRSRSGPGWCGGYHWRLICRLSGQTFRVVQRFHLIKRAGLSGFGGHAVAAQLTVAENLDANLVVALLPEQPLFPCLPF